MIKKDEGIILNVIPFSDTDAILSIYSQNHGKKSFIVKGGLSNKSKKRPYMQVGYWVEFIFYEKATRELQKITDIHLIYLFKELNSSPIKNCLFMTMIELFRETVREEETPDKHLYHFFINYIIQLENTQNPWKIWLEFHEFLLAQIGYGGNIIQEPSFEYSHIYCPSIFFLQKVQKIYNEYSKHIENFKIPKSFEVLRQLVRIDTSLL